MTNGNDPTNAITAELIDRCGEVNFSPFGLTKREYFAAMRNEPMYGEQALSMQWATTLMGCEPPSDSIGNIKWWVLAHEKFAVMRADALIEALNK